MITQEFLKELLHYCPDTGVLTWRPRDNPRFKHANCEAGSKFAAPCGKNYRHVRVMGKMYLAHRLIFMYVEGAFPKRRR